MKEPFTAVPMVAAALTVSATPAMAATRQLPLPNPA